MQYNNLIELLASSVNIGDDQWQSSKFNLRRIINEIKEDIVTVKSVKGELTIVLFHCYKNLTDCLSKESIINSNSFEAYDTAIQSMNLMIELNLYDPILVIRTANISLIFGDHWTYKQLIFNFAEYNRYSDMYNSFLRASFDKIDNLGDVLSQRNLTHEPNSSNTNTNRLSEIHKLNNDISLGQIFDFIMNKLRNKEIINNDWYTELLYQFDHKNYEIDSSKKTEQFVNDIPQYSESNEKDPIIMKNAFASDNNNKETNFSIANVNKIEKRPTRSTRNNSETLFDSSQTNSNNISSDYSDSDIWISTKVISSINH